MSLSVAQRTAADREDHCIALAGRVLARLEQVSGRKQLPVPVETIAALCGYQVVLLTTLPPELSGLVSLEKRLIGINGKHHSRRQRFSIAHELGHILLKHPPEIDATPFEIRIVDREADVFAAELLMPTADLTIMVENGESVESLRQRYGVSKEALRIKIQALGNPKL